MSVNKSDDSNLNQSRRASLAPLDEPYLGRVVSVSSFRGGAGKSTLSVIIASYLSNFYQLSEADDLRLEGGLPGKRKLKVLLLDLDIIDGQISAMIGRKAPTVMKLLLGGINDEQIKYTKIYDKDLGIDLILAPIRSRSSSELTPEFYQELIADLKTRYDYIILDTPASLTDPLLEHVAYPLSDLILFASRLTSGENSAERIEELTVSKEGANSAVSRDNIKIIVNRPALKLSTDELQSYFDGAVLTVIPDLGNLHDQSIQSVASDVFKDEQLTSVFRPIMESIMRIQPNRN